MCVCVCVCMCVWAGAYARARACVCVCVHECVCMCVYVCVCVRARASTQKYFVISICFSSYKRNHICRDNAVSCVCASFLQQECIAWGSSDQVSVFELFFFTPQSVYSIIFVIPGASFNLHKYLIGNIRSEANM